jgi:drug/metabolite transporter (DMT)-like permease
MMFWISLAAAFGVALCNGVAAILQKEGADTQTRASSINPNLVWKLLHDWRYTFGIALDLAAGGLILVAVHSLPLFLAQSVIACSIVITFVIERFILRRYDIRRAYPALGLVLAGLVLLALAAAPEEIRQASMATHWGILLAIVPIGLLGALFSRIAHPVSAVFLGSLAGVAFGGTAVAGRVLTLPSPAWHILSDPALYAFGLYGGLGILLFTVGLQRASATTLTTIMVTAETLAPAIVGIVLLGDTVRPGLWPAAVGGVTLTLTGALIIAAGTQRQLAAQPTHV